MDGGCEAMGGTMKVTVQIPDEIVESTAVRHDSFGLDVELSPLQTPIPATRGGGEQTERLVKAIFWRNTEDPSTAAETFEFTAKVPKDPEAESLYFPVVQTCLDEEVRWDEIPPDGETADSLEFPAPVLHIDDQRGRRLTVPLAAFSAALVALVVSRRRRGQQPK